MDSPGSRPDGRARVAPPADGLVLYRRARSSWRSVQSSESNELPASLRPAGCPERERTRRKRYCALSAGIGCSDETCGSTTGACIRGYNDEGTSARTARLRNTILTPLSKIGRITCTPPTSSVWSTMTRSSGKNMPQVSS